MAEYNLTEFASLVKLSNKTLRGFVKTGFLRGQKHENEWRFTHRDILAFFNEPTVYEVLKNRYAYKVKEFIFEGISNDNQTLISFYLNFCDELIIGEIIECIGEFEREYGVEILFFVKQGVPSVICYGNSTNVKEALAAFRSKPQLKESIEKMRLENT